MIILQLLFGLLTGEVKYLYVEMFDTAGDTHGGEEADNFIKKPLD